MILSVSPRWASAIWSGSRPLSAAAASAELKSRATATAPPNQQAATPMPPQAKPGRWKYHPGPPTGTALTPSKCTVPLGISRRPRLVHCGVSQETPGACRLTAKAALPPDSVPGVVPAVVPAVDPALPPPPRAICAVTTAPSSWAASEHQGLEPFRTYAPAPSATASSRSPGPSAANTPQAASAALRHRWAPAWDRMATASRCGSSTRPAATSTAVTDASSSHSRAVLPSPGRGAVRPMSRARASSAGTSPAASRTEPSNGAMAPSWSGVELIRTACGPAGTSLRPVRPPSGPGLPESCLSESIPLAVAGFSLRPEP